MDQKSAPSDLTAPLLEPVQPFLGNKILLFLSLGILAVLIFILLIYKTYFAPPPRLTTTSPKPAHTFKTSVQPTPFIEEGDQTIFAIGGFYRDKTTHTTPATNSAEFYDFDIGKWQLIPPMHYSHAAAGTTVYDGKIYVFGGHEGNVWEGTTNVEMFDPKTSTWTIMAPMLHARSFEQAIPLGDKMYLLGGFNEEGSEDWSMDIYTPATNSWQTGPVIPSGDVTYTTPRCAPFQNAIYCPGLGMHTYTLEYDPTTNTWQTLPTENRLPTGYFTWASNGGVMYGVYFENGNILYQYEPGVDTITPIKAGKYINRTYQGFGSIAFDNYMFLVGGEFSREPVSDVYIFDLIHPSSWQKFSVLNIGRLEPGVVILPSLYSLPTASPSSTPYPTRN